MGFFDVIKLPDIDKGVEAYKSVPGAVLLDVRSGNEYKEGHIPESKNLPLQVIENAEKEILDKNAPLFVYCYSGARSERAVAALKEMGFSCVKNIGGISSYSGKIEA